MNRNNQYFELSSKLSSINDSKLCDMLDKGNLNKKGWGTNHVIKIDKTKVFAKKVPLTQIEFDNSFSTKNHYDLPTVYNYGIGSAGFGAFRELLLHIKTTNWVLNKECLNFPLMYHYRIIKRTEGIAKRDDKNYFKYWNNDQGIKSYIKARNKAPYELVLFLEYIPQTFQSLLDKDKSKAVKIGQKVIETIKFLKEKGIIHMDMHFLNILTDGKNPYITDFGLGIDKAFDLSKEEKVFFKKHTNYDFGEVIGCMGLQLNGEFDNLSKSNKVKVSKFIDLKESDDSILKQKKIIKNLNILKKEGFFNLTNSYIKYLKDHESIIILTTKFFVGVRSSKDRSKDFSGTRLKRELIKANLLHMQQSA